jgi:hypothetical protein
VESLPKPTQDPQHCSRIPDTPRATTTGPPVPHSDTLVATKKLRKGSYRKRHWRGRKVSNEFWTEWRNNVTDVTCVLRNQIGFQWMSARSKMMTASSWDAAPRVIMAIMWIIGGLIDFLSACRVDRWWRYDHSLCWQGNTIRKQSHLDFLLGALVVRYWL